MRDTTVSCQPTACPRPTDALSCQSPPYPTKRPPILSTALQPPQLGSAGPAPLSNVDCFVPHTRMPTGIQRYLAPKKPPTPLGPPKDRRRRPTVGSWGGAFSYGEVPLYTYMYTRVSTEIYVYVQTIHLSTDHVQSVHRLNTAFLVLNNLYRDTSPIRKRPLP